LKHSTSHARFSARLFRLGFLAILAVGAAVAPFTMARLTAQEPAASSQAGAAAKPEPAKSEEEDNNVYRHTALVESAAKALHLPVETTARGFEFINFAIIVLAIGIPLFKFLPKFLRKRSKDLDESIATARKVSEDANARLSAVEAKLSSLDEEIAKFRSEVEQEMKQDEVRIKTTLEEESARIVAAAEQEISVAAAQARRGLKHFAADLAIEQAAKQLVLTPETDRALIAEFVSGVSATAKANGGQK
jgi:F-type H+-transporting ATPase subunit b